MLTTTTPKIILDPVSPGETAHYKFNITNNGTKPLTLQASASCGCTTPTLPKSTILPFEMLEGTGTYRAGRFADSGTRIKKAIYITPSEGERLTLDLYTVIK